MASMLRNSTTKSMRASWAALMLLLSSLIIILGSLDAYLIEDDGVAGKAAHKFFPLVNLTYEGMYISAMVVFVLAVFLCLQLVSLWFYSGRRSVGWLALIAAFTILLAFGGLLVRQPLMFSIVIGSFILILMLVIGLGHRLERLLIKEKEFSSTEGNTGNTLSGASISLFLALIFNLICAIWHTVAVQWQSPQLYKSTFSGLTGNHFSEYILFSVLGVGFVLCAGIAILIVHSKGGRQLFEEICKKGIGREK